MPPRITIAASPGATKAISIAPSPTTTRRSSSIRPPPPTTIAAAPGPPRARTTARIADLDQAIKLDPRLADAYINRGNAKRERLDLAAAVADYTLAISLSPNAALAYYNRAWAHYLAGESAEALADADRAIDVDDHSASAFSTRGLIREKMGEPTARSPISARRSSSTRNSSSRPRVCNGCKKPAHRKANSQRMHAEARTTASCR